MNNSNFVFRSLKHAGLWCVATVGSVLPVKTLQRQAVRFVVDNSYKKWFEFLLKKPSFKNLDLNNFISDVILKPYFETKSSLLYAQMLEIFVRSGGCVHNYSWHNTFQGDPRQAFFNKLLRPFEVDNKYTCLEWLAYNNAVPDYLKFSAVMSTLDGAQSHTDCQKIAERLFVHWKMDFNRLQHSSQRRDYWTWMCSLSHNGLLRLAIQQAPKDFLPKEFFEIANRKNINADIIEAIVDKGISRDVLLWRVAQHNGISLPKNDPIKLRDFMNAVNPTMYEAVVEYDQRIDSLKLNQKLQDEIGSIPDTSEPIAVPLMRRKI